MADPPPTLSSLPLGDFLHAVASDDPTPGGGAVSGMVAAMAAALTAMAARYAAREAEKTEWARELVRQADQLMTQAVSLAEEDAAVYGRYSYAVRMPREPDPEPRRRAMRTALDQAADVPYRLTELARHIARVGALLAADGSPHLRSDACTASLLASAVASSAELLVTENLRKHPDDTRVAQASRNAANAEASAANARAPKSKER
jgi:formiminotetrahydrofolate cyclodeaminase